MWWTVIGTLCVAGVAVVALGQRARALGVEEDREETADEDAAD